MSTQATTHQSASDRADGDHDGSQAIEVAARAGYATKGVVYMIIGGLAAAAAWGTGGQTTGSKGAISEIGSQPFGEVLLWVVAIGLLGYAIWRLFSAAVDADNKGSDAKGWAKRAAIAASGIAYGMLAWMALPVSSSGGGGGGGGKQTLVADLLGLPGGKWIVAAIGAAVVGYGAFQIYKGLADKFMDKYDSSEMSERECKVARYSGRLGLTARGLTMGIVGAFIVVAGFTLDPSRVKGVGDTLDLLGRQAFGAWVLLAVAIGLACYGLFCLVQARYRNFMTTA